MALSLEKSYVCPVVIGRDGEIALLERVLEQVRGGHGQTVLVAGEAGIGKSRLVATVRAHAEGLGFPSFQGQCFEADAAYPYAPLVDLVRTHMAGQPSDALASDSSLAISELRGLVPELAGSLAGLASPIPLEPEQEKQRLFHAAIRFILGQPGGKEKLVVVEDLHWSDDTSLELLLFLARQVHANPLLLVLTYRSDEIGPGLRHFLAELDRGRLARELVLTPLTRAETGAMLQATLGSGRHVRAGFRDTLFALTDGNPFFVEEMLKVLANSGNLPGEGGVDSDPHGYEPIAPRSVQDAVLRRLVRVSAPAQKVLALAAVAGPRFDFSLLRTIAGQSEGAFLRHIKELVAAQLVVEESAERFAFRHALTRQTIYGQLLRREREALHRTIVETIERVYAEAADAHLPDLAYHAYAAGLWEKALSYARRMGDQALALGAPRSAIEQFTRAIEASRQLGRAPDPVLRRARGQAYEVRGEFERARDDYEAALEAARAVGDQGAEWQGLLGLGFLWLARDYERAGDFLRQACELARRMDDRQRLAHSLNRLGNWYGNMERPRQALDLHRQALAIFRDLANQAGIAETLDLVAVATYVGGDRRGAIAHFEEAAALSRASGDRRALASVLATLGHLRSASAAFETLPGGGRRAGQAVGACEEALTIARQIDWRPGEAYALAQLTICLSAEGEFGRALATAQEGLEIATEIEHREWLAIAHVGLGKLFMDLLAPIAARWHCERAHTIAREAGTRHFMGLTAAYLAEACLMAGDPARADSVLRDFMPLDAPVETLAQSVVLAAYGDLSLVRGEPSQALEVADRLIAWAARAGGADVIPYVWKVRGEALAALGQTDQAEAVLGAAREAAREQGARPLLWRLDVALGRLLQAQARRDEAEQAHAAARVLIEELAGTVPDEALRKEFLGRALAQIPTPRRLSPRALARLAYGGLTEREREVVGLIARGLSNRQIAEALVISERTVEAHTGHVRDKLALTSRTQVAAWAVEHGLLLGADEPPGTSGSSPSPR